jgi:uncharacterized protein YndB with AHSA1/START domain
LHIVPAEESTMEKQDTIEREIVVRAPIERVWQAITSVEDVAQWFGDIAEIDLRPGGRAKLGWTEFDSLVDAIVEVVEPPRRFSYRWSAAYDTAVEDGPSTLVEFILDAVAEGTLITLIESGFAALPDDIYESTLAGNESGWTAELQDLVSFLSVREEV